MSELYVAIAAVLVAGVTVAVPAVDADGPSFAFHWFPRLRPLPVHRAGRAALPSSPRKFSARPSHKTEEGRAQISKTRERSGRQAVPEQRGPQSFLMWGMARRASVANATERGSGFGLKNDCCHWLSFGSVASVDAAPLRALRFALGTRMIGKSRIGMRRMRRWPGQDNRTSITTIGRNA